LSRVWGDPQAAFVGCQVSSTIHEVKADEGLKREEVSGSRLFHVPGVL
jgi:hypothetical protein